MKKIIKLSFLLALLVFLVIPVTVGAQIDEVTGDPIVTESSTGVSSIKDRLSNVGSKAGFTTDPNIASTPKIIGVVVGAFINFTGLIFIVLMIIAGYGWMTSNGNEEKTKKAVSTIKAAIIGLIVSLSAWVIWNFIFEKLIG